MLTSDDADLASVDTDHAIMARSTPVRQIAILGAGRVGTAVGRALVEAGYDVTLAGSGDPAQVALITSIIAPGTRARWAADAVTGADLIILAVPMHRLASLDPSLLTGRIVVDATNYWPPVDGELGEFEGAHDGSSSVVQRMFPHATIIKTLNHVGYHDLETGRRPAGHPERLGLAVSGDDPRAVAVVAAVIDSIGYDPVPLPALAAGRFLQPGSTVFGARLTAGQIARVTRWSPGSATRRGPGSPRPTPVRK